MADRLTETVLAYEGVMRELVVQAKAPGFTVADWEPLAQFVDTANFERVGTWLEVMDWGHYLDFLTKWAGAAEFETTVHRISEVGNLVYFEIEERHTVGENRTVVNSLTVFEFDQAGKIIHLDVFLQKQR